MSFIHIFITLQTHLLRIKGFQTRLNQTLIGGFCFTWNNIGTLVRITAAGV